MNLEIKEGSFYSGDRKVFLNSGEIHYFRIRREYWDTHLQAARDAGLTTVSSYVPWAWHEPEKGLFDFEGITCPERDLKGWLEKCSRYGLTAVLKPGPFILAETRGAGLPQWFLDESGDRIRMRTRSGNPVASDGVNLFHDEFQRQVDQWYDQVIPLIAQHESAAGGPVILMQICNEIGVFSWLAHQADYGGPVRTLFIDWLKRQYPGIEQLNREWQTQYADFDQVELPPDGFSPYESRSDRARDFIWHRFWRFYYAEYLRLLTKKVRDRGLGIPVYHNLPGWIYGSGYEFPVNITMYDDLYRDASGILFGVDHIPEYVSYRNMHDDRIINDITRAVQGNVPLFAAEFQCGSREYHVVTNSREMELFYKASIAKGLTGWNYYMFSQGRNPARRGYSGDTFYWYNPLTPEGKRTAAFPLIERMSKIVHSLEPLILNSERKADLCVLFYPPYYSTELERPETGASGLAFNPSAIRRQAWFDGLLRALQWSNIEYDMADLSRVSVEDLRKYSQVWAFSTDEMNAREQQILIQYLTQGGNLVMYPALPDRDFAQQPCSLLRDFAGISDVGRESIDSPLIDILGHPDIKCANPQLTYRESELQGAEIIARTLTGAPCGFRRRLGKGELVHLGTWLGFDTEGHLPVYEALVKLSGCNLRQAHAEGADLIVRQRFAPDQQALLFIGNYYTDNLSGRIHFTHPANGELITLPYGNSPMEWPALSGLLTPVNVPLSEGIRLLYCTSDLLSVETEPGKICLILSARKDMPGELAIEGAAISGIYSMDVNGTVPDSQRDANRLILNYSNSDISPVILTLLYKK